MKKAVVIIFEDFEEMEAIAPIDILRRAQIEVCVATLGDKLSTKGRSAITLVADKLFSEIKNDTFDALVISGGSGTMKIAENKELLDFVKKHDLQNKIVSAICAAPIVLKNAGVLEGKTCTCHTSKEVELAKYFVENKDVEVSQNAITSRGAGTATEFALELVKALSSQAAANNIANSICY